MSLAGEEGVPPLLSEDPMETERREREAPPHADPNLEPPEMPLVPPVSPPPLPIEEPDEHPPAETSDQDPADPEE